MERLHDERIKRVRARMEEAGIDRLIVTDPLSIYYLTDIEVHPGERFWALLMSVGGGLRLFANKLFSLGETSIPVELFDDNADIDRVVAPYLLGGVIGVDKTMAARFLLPIMAISEVLRHMPLALLPRAPRHVAGVINLRGRLTPLVHLCMLVSSDASPRYNADSLVVVCPCGGIQIGLIIDKVENIYTVQQQELNWNPETHFGEAAECLYALARIGEHLYGILAPERIGQILCR